MEEEMADDRVVIVRGGTQGFAQDITIGRHHLVADEPVSAGGTDRGPDAYQLIAAALGA
jgi:putative redox protein